MNISKILYTTIKKHILMLVVGIICSILSLWISFEIPFINQKIIDEGIMSNNYNILISMCLSLVLMYVFEYIFNIFSKYVFSKIAKEYTMNIYNKIISNLFLKKHNFFVENSSGELQQKISEAWNLEDIFSVELFESVVSVFSIIVAIVVLLKISVFITLFSIISVLLACSFYFFGNYFMGKYMTKVLDKNIETTSKIQEIIMGIFEIRSNAASKLFMENSKTKVAEKCKLSLKFSILVPSFFNAVATCTSILMVGILYFCGVDIMSGTLTFGTYILIVSYVQKIISPIMQAGSVINSIKPVLILAKRLNNHFSLDNEDFTLIEDSHPKDISNFEIKGLSYSYSYDSQNVFSNLDLKAKKGDIILMKGANGCGKSTILNIISGELKYRMGEILFEGEKGNPQDFVSIVRQRPYIFNLNLCENIILSEPFDCGRYKKVLDILQFDSYFDQDLIDGNITIQENGNALSGGQIKIIALARCLYRKRPILILDETFSNMDANMRQLIVNFLKEYRKEYITLIVEHTNEFDFIANKIINVKDFVK
ncbi:MAG: ABC transporter ATP-binding protein/permease [Clostridia bacterium]|nr:ABC transporter ATP-binding protein/permease [Clostridia bacterium]